MWHTGGMRPPDIETERLVLIALLAADVEGLVAGNHDRVGRTLGIVFPPAWPQDREASEGLAWHLRHLRTHSAHIPWRIPVIVERASMSVVGSINLKGPPGANGDVEIGWGLVESQRRRGYALEAAAAVISWVAAQPAVKSVSATVPKDNLASQRLAARLGMVLTENVRHDLPLWQLEVKRH
jgi:RimJ/RimL family protein N-acetyltransferase